MSVSSDTEPAVQLRVLDLDPAGDARWDAFVRGCPDGLVFHHSAWLQTLAREYAQPQVTLACEDAAGRLHGVLPLAYTRGLPLGLGGGAAGRRLSSLPRTPVAGVLASSHAAATALVAAALERVSAESGTTLQLKAQGTELDGVPGLVRTPWRLNYALELPEDPDSLRFGNSRNHARIKWAVSKATRSGLHVRPAESEAELRAWYRLYLDVNRYRLQPPRPYRLFEAAWRLLQPLGLMRLWLVERRQDGDAEIVAGSLLLMLGGTVFYAFNGRRQDALPLRANDLVQWHAIRAAAAEGYQRYDFGEVADANDELAAFKAKWGTQATRLHRYVHPAPRQASTGYEELESEGALRRVARPLWRRVPLALTARAGDLVYRRL